MVDDAIIVGENIALFRERGFDPEEAAIKGAAQVTTPVIFAVLTTMATFSPMLAVSGTIGAIWRIFPLITIIVLFWSLIESLTILPAHLAHSVETKPKNNMLGRMTKSWGQFQDKVKKFLEKFVEKKYKPTLLLAVKNPFNSLALAIAVFVLTLGMILSGVLKFSFFPPIEGDIAIATIEYPSGTPIEVTQDGICIWDEGNPINIEEREKIFEKGFRGKSGAKIAGSGIGLALARDLARQLGGDLKLVVNPSQFQNSLPESGNAFVFNLEPK